MLCTPSCARSKFIYALMCETRLIASIKANKLKQYVLISEYAPISNMRLITRNTVTMLHLAMVDVQTHMHSVYNTHTHTHTSLHIITSPVAIYFFAVIR